MPKCKEPTCRKEIFFIKHERTGKECPMSIKNGKLISHFLDCTNPERFSNHKQETIEQKITRLTLDIEECTECTQGLLEKVLCNKCIKINNKITKLKAQDENKLNQIQG